MNSKADIGVFGGSGFYSFLKDVEEIEIETPYGKPVIKFHWQHMMKKNSFSPRHGKIINCRLT